MLNIFTSFKIRDFLTYDTLSEQNKDDYMLFVCISKNKPSKTQL